MRFWFSWYWVSWLIAFIVPELYWFIVNSNGTFSDMVWSLEGINARQPFDFPMWTAVHWEISFIVWILFAWLSVHLPFGLLR